MRKRIVIVLVVLIVGGGLAALVFRPWESRLEYHKRGYLRAEHWGRVERWIDGNAPQMIGKAQARWKSKREEFHAKALFELGYVEERTFVLSNTVTNANAFWALHNVFTNDTLDLSGIRDIGTNTVTVIGLPEDMPKWEEAVRKINAPGVDK